MEQNIVDTICVLLWENHLTVDKILYKLIRDNQNIINDKNQKGQTPLYIAFRTANITATNLLVNNGAKLTELNTDGSSPVMGFLWDYDKYNTQHKNFFHTFRNIIVNSCDRKLTLHNKKLFIENKNGDDNAISPDGFLKKYSDMKFQLIGPYVTISEKSPGYYFYNNANSMISCYKFDDGKLSHEFQSKFILKKIGKNIFTDILDLHPYHKIINVPKIYVTDNIASDIKNENNANHYFMLPSQLNGAEYPSDETIVNNFKEYLCDRTAGPAGQLAVHAGIGQFIIDNATNSNNKNGINAVKYILGHEPDKAKIKLINGYLKVPQRYPHTHIIKSHIADLMTICIENIPVDGWDQLKNSPINKNHKINLIYASAVPINTYLNNYNNDTLIDIANIILIGEYFGALQLAYIKGYTTQTKQVIHLTLLGGGVFNNSKEDISDSIIKAIFILEKLYTDVSTYLEIRLQIYKSTSIANWYDNKFSIHTA